MEKGINEKQHTVTASVYEISEEIIRRSKTLICLAGKRVQSDIFKDAQASAMRRLLRYYLFARIRLWLVTILQEEQADANS